MGSNVIVDVSRYKVDEKGNQENSKIFSLESDLDKVETTLSTMKRSFKDMGGVEMVKIEDITNKNNRRF